MSVFCGWWALALLMGVTCASAASPLPPGAESAVMPELPPDTRCTMWVSSPVVD